MKEWCCCRRGHQDEVLGDAITRRLGVHAMAERHEGGGSPAGGYTTSVQENREYLLLIIQSCHGSVGLSVVIGPVSY